jgi:hypothetical protein
LFLNPTSSKTDIMIATGLKTLNEEQEIKVVKASDGTTIIKDVKDFKYI